jgi:hypothetical protein
MAPAFQTRTVPRTGGWDRLYWQYGGMRPPLDGGSRGLGGNRCSTCDGREFITLLSGAAAPSVSWPGYTERENVAIEYRWAENQVDRLPDLAAELVRRQVAVIATTGSLASVLAAKAATTAIPIVFNIANGQPLPL